MPTRKAPKKRVRPTPSNAVDEQLARYRSMRDFKITAEPAGGTTKSPPKSPAQLPFVIQKHSASHLHYDFRLGWAGVLKSWAVAKGPSLNPKDRRLAVQVEDHPLEYGGFEGIIPKGQYGGGTVMVWDQGTWSPQPESQDVDAALRDGHLKFELNGTKLKGKWALIRMSGRAASESKPNWLLIKEHDPYGRDPSAPPITDEAPNSAITGRSLDQIAADEDHVWQSSKTAYLRDPSLKVPKAQPWHRNPPSATIKKSAPAKKSANSYASTPKKPASSTEAPKRSVISTGAPKRSVISAEAPKKPVISTEAQRSGETRSTRQSPSKLPALSAKTLAALPKESQPAFISPQLALETTTPPSTSDWLHELKLDGYRIQARKSSPGSGARPEVELLTRKGLDWTARMPAIAAAVATLPAQSCTLDGEVVVLGPDGNSSFADLQASFQDSQAHPLTYFVFDLLHLDGRNTRNLPLRNRKLLLADLLSVKGTPLRPSASIAGKKSTAPPALKGTGFSPSVSTPDKNGALAPEGISPEDDTLRLSEDIAGDGPVILRHACELHAEGIISKRADAPYRTTRSSDWLKSKCRREQELVIAGYTLSSADPRRIGSLLLGYYETARSRKSDARKLIYAGRTGTGFTQKLRRDLFTQLCKLRTPEPAFNTISTDARRGALWVKPTLVAEVRFATWTSDNLVRQAAFLGLREDKSPTEVTREEPTVAPIPKSSRRSSLHPQTTLSHAIRNPKPTPASTTFPISHPEKVLDPQSGLTKQQLADYYTAVAPLLLPHIIDRPVSIVRCPDGTDNQCFFQRHITSKLPPGIHSISIADKKSGKPEPYITLRTPEALLSLAQLGVLEIHPWGSRNNDLEHPDRLIFDLDPDESLPWTTLCSAAAEVRKRLKKAGLQSFLKLTGGKGLHVVAPLKPSLTWSELKDLAHKFVLSMERDNPSLYLTKMTKSARPGKIFLDYLRNERGATAVAPYSPRARLGVHVSLPLPWSALNETARPVFSVHDFPAWSSRLRTDPWKALLSTTQQLLPKKFDAL